MGTGFQRSILILWLPKTVLSVGLYQSVDQFCNQHVHFYQPWKKMPLHEHWNIKNRRSFKDPDTCTYTVYKYVWRTNWDVCMVINSKSSPIYSWYIHNFVSYRLILISYFSVDRGININGEELHKWANGHVLCVNM